MTTRGAPSSNSMSVNWRTIAEPHVQEWWDEGPEASLAEIREAMDSVETEPLIVELRGRPIAYIQSYDPHPDNLRAVRAYEKAGFCAFDTRTSIYGPALMMARDAE